MPYYADPEHYIDFIESTLIPDLRESGQRRLAQDFEEAVYWIRDGMGIYQGRSSSAAKIALRSPLRKKRKQSGKAKILTAMTAPVWKKYKKGSGKKTYVQIRAQVSRSQAYKRKVRNL